jgi:hypothetical protein
MASGYIRETLRDACPMKTQVVASLCARDLVDRMR